VFSIEKFLGKKISFSWKKKIWLENQTFIFCYIKKRFEKKNNVMYKLRW
jgi:hypothetical protein